MAEWRVREMESRWIFAGETLKWLKMWGWEKKGKRNIVNFVDRFVLKCKIIVICVML